MTDNTITIVSGLPRSGTSMMMKMLEAGGIPPLIDGIRTADQDNPKGYYEFERVKQLPNGDDQWLPDARGNTVKIISALLNHLPQNEEYRIIFMQRRIEEVLRSQQKMLVHREKENGEEGNEATEEPSDDDLIFMFQKHLLQTEMWLLDQPNIQTHYVDYNQLMLEPINHIAQINEFLGGQLNETAMLEAIDPALYRNRA